VVEIERYLHRLFVMWKLRLCRVAGPFAEYSDYAYEAVAELLGEKFGETCNVWVVRPNRFKQGAYSSFDNFVTTNDYGAATECTSSFEQKLREFLHLLTVMVHLLSVCR
jgi:hypothetical protein